MIIFASHARTSVEVRRVRRSDRRLGRHRPVRRTDGTNRWIHGLAIEKSICLVVPIAGDGARRPGRCPRRSDRVPRLRWRSAPALRRPRTWAKAPSLESLGPHREAISIPVHDADTVASLREENEEVTAERIVRNTSRTSTIRLSVPLRPSTGCVATNRRTLGGRLSTRRQTREPRAVEREPPRRTKATGARRGRSGARPRSEQRRRTSPR